MGELDKKWFRNVWLCLLFVSVMLNCIQRLVDAAWAHSAGIEMLDKVLLWITLSLTVIIFIWHCVGYWRTSKRLFWRMLRRWCGGLTIGVVCEEQLQDYASRRKLPVQLMRKFLAANL